MKMTRKRVVVLALLASLAAAGGFSCESKDSSTAFRSPAANPDNDAAMALNKIIMEVKTAAQVETALSTLAGHSLKNTAGGYLYASLAQAAIPLRGILWRLGGVAVQSEALYMAIVGSVVSLKQARHLYSDPVNAFIDYLLQPVTDTKGLPLPGVPRLRTMAQLQQLLVEYDAMVKDQVDAVEAIYNKNPNFLISFDRQLISRGSFVNDSGRWPVFIRPYLASGLSAAYITRAGIKYLAAYDLDDLTDYLNHMVREQIVGSALHKSLDKPVLEWRKLTQRLRTGDRTFDPKSYANIKVNTSMDYRAALNDYPNLFKFKGDHVTLLRQAHEALVKGVDFDIAWATEMAAYAGKDPKGYIVDARMKMADPAYSAEHYKAVKQFLTTVYDVTDPVTGTKIRTNLPAAFSASAKPIRDLLPTDWYEKSLSFRDTTGLPTFRFERGRPTVWADPTFGGILPDAVNPGTPNVDEKNFFPNTHRILIYNDDTTAFFGAIFSFLI